MTDGNSAERQEVRRQTRRKPGTDRIDPEEGDGLTTEDAGLLVEAFRDLLLETRPEEASAPELRDRIRRLLASLDHAPGSRTLQRESLELLRSWSDVWVEELEAGRKSAADSVRTLLVSELTRLKRVVDEEG